jgi:hypothetical protein
MLQGSLFSLPPITSEAQSPTASLAGVMPAIRAAMNRVAGEYADGRKMLVDRINEVAERECVPLTSGGGKNITIDQLNKFLQPGAGGHEPTLTVILCFCLATRDFSAMAPVLAVSGLCIVPREELKYLEYGKSCWGLKEAKQKQRKMEAWL